MAINPITGREEIPELLLSRLGGISTDVGVTVEQSLVFSKAARLDLSSAVPSTSNTDGAVFKAGSSSTPASTPVATTVASQSMFRLIWGLDHTGSYGFYNRAYVRTAAISADASRLYATVLDVAAATVRGLHCSLSFGDTGSVTGLGAAAEFTLHIPGSGSAAGTLYAVKAAIHSDDAASDPAGATTLAFFGAVNQGNATGGADVDDDAVLLHIDGVTLADGNLVDTPTTGYQEADITHGIKIKVNSTILYLLASSAAPSAT